MDAFFAAVEQLDNPEYRGKPVIVGSDPRGRGVVSTCSYEARKFGVRSAMPIREAFRRCPQGIFLPVRGARYAEISRHMMRVFEEYTPLVEPLSLDEAFLDLTGSESIFGPAEVIAKRIVQRIRSEIGLSASVGLAPNKFLAKLASDLQKPAGFVVVTPENMMELTEQLPIGKLWGVGPKTEAEMIRFGITTIGILRKVDVRRFRDKFGENGMDLYRLAYGIDDRPVINGEISKSVGHEMTFQQDTDDRQFLAGVLLWLSEQVGRRLRRYQLRGRVITVKIRDSHFKTMTKQLTLNCPTDFEEDIYQYAYQLADELDWTGGKVRLIGVSVSGFNVVKESQLGLFEETAPSRIDELERLHRTVDDLKNRFGEGIITKGTILHIKGKFGDRHPDDSES